MNNWKHYTGSILLAGLLLQGCSGTPEDKANDNDQKAGITYKSVQVSNQTKFEETAKVISDSDITLQDKIKKELKLKVQVLEENDPEMAAFIAKIMKENKLSKTEACNAIAERLAGDDTTTVSKSASKAANRGIFSGLTDKIKDGLVDILDSSLGDKITGAAFDVVLNSDGVTVFMLDLARKSQTVTDVMINALDENWELTRKMCPMLQENAEFGEKFVALAYEKPNLGEFFFEKIDATMYGCLTDAMILSSVEEMETEKGLIGYDKSVKHSTTGYMGILLERYATKYFIEPGTGTVTYKDGSTDQFAKLLFTTGDVVTVDGDVTTGHGDAVELVNEQFFYAMFRTPTSTDSFVAAMGQLPDADVTMFMDEIFLGKKNTVASGEQEDQLQGYFNIISVAGGMYEGIETYGFSEYSGAFIGFARLIPTDRYFAYGAQFMSAGYFWAEQSGVDIWATVTDGAKDLYAQYTEPAIEEQTNLDAPARSAGRGVIGTGTSWAGDVFDLVGTAWTNMDLVGYIGSDLGALDYYNNEALLAYDAVVGGPDSAVLTTITTTVDGVEYTDSVAGIHGLLQLAVREDMVNNNHPMTMTEAEAAFALPAFSDITWDFVYTASTDGAAAYWNNTVDADWLADFSETPFVQYFYPAAENAYIPSWLKAIDWLKVPATAEQTFYADMEISFDAGYMDIYVVSESKKLLSNVDLKKALNPVKDNIEFTQVAMGSDSIITVDADGKTLKGLYVYKLRVVTPEDTEAVLAALAGLTDKLGNKVLNAIGIDTDNAAQAASN